MNVTRDTIFISHSTPEDNYSASWLAAKLKFLGYKVWVDVEDLSAGDSFNTVIKPIIKDQAKVFVPITTKKYSEKSNNQNSGVSRELNCAATVDTKQLGHNFFFPVRFDDIPYNDFPYHFTGWNGINFEGNWQQGLIDLVKELDKINFPKQDVIDNPINIWFNAIKVQNKAHEKVEKYFSNWFGMELPTKIYVHEPKTLSKGLLPIIPYPLILEANRIICFACKETIQNYVALNSSFDFDTTDLSVSSDLIVDNNFTLKEPRKKLIRLLNNSLQHHFSAKGLICWVRGKRTKKKTYYFKSNDENKKSIPLKRFNKPKGRRDLVGLTNETINAEKKKVHWAMSLMCQADLEPVPHYKIFYGLVFSDEKFKRFDKDVQHQLRRSVPSGWYNRKWFETLLAAMLKVSPSYDSEHISIAIDDEKFLRVNNEPFNGVSQIGYIEPDDIE